MPELILLLALFGGGVAAGYAWRARSDVGVPEEGREARRCALPLPRAAQVVARPQHCVRNGMAKTWQCTN
jgi:hypothetical protein